MAVASDAEATDDRDLGSVACSDDPGGRDGPAGVSRRSACAYAHSQRASAQVSHKRGLCLLKTCAYRVGLIPSEDEVEMSFLPCPPELAPDELVDLDLKGGPPRTPSEGPGRTCHRNPKLFSFSWPGPELNRTLGELVLHLFYGGSEAWQRQMAVLTDRQWLPTTTLRSTPSPSTSTSTVSPG